MLKSKIILVFVITILILSFNYLDDIFAQASILDNNFENGTIGSYTTIGEISVENFGYSSSKCLKLDRTLFHQYVMSEPLDFEKGKTYEFSVYVKSKSYDFSRFRIYINETNPIIFVTTENRINGYDWTKITGTVKMTNTITQKSIIYQLQDRDNVTDSIYFDNFLVRELSEADGVILNLGNSGLSASETQTNTMFSVKCELVNMSESRSGKAIAALYENEKLVDVAVTDVFINAGEIKPLNLNLTKKTGQLMAYTYKVMFWENLSEAKPITNFIKKAQRLFYVPDLPNEPIRLSGLEQSVAAKEIFVSPVTGNDAGDGSKESPFKTIERAKTEANLIKNSVNGDIYVYLRGGTYPLQNTLTFSKADEGVNGNRIIYSGYENEKATITSYKTINNFTKTTDLPIEINQDIRSKVFVADIPVDSYIKTLYSNGVRLNRAKGRAFFPVSQSQVGWSGDEVFHKTMVVPSDVLYNWDNIKDVELHIRPTAAWAFNILPIDKIDLSTNSITTTVPGEYVLGKVIIFNDTKGTAWFENAPKFIQNPGDWAVDTKKGKLYYYPQDENDLNVAWPTLKELIKIEGDIDFAGANDTPVKGIYFRNIIFEGAARDTYPIDYRGYELQHAWDLYDRDNAAIRFRGTEDCGLIDCEIKNVDGGGIRIDLYGKYNLISGNLFKNIGGTGILLCGYGPGTKDVNGYNNIINNHIDGAGKLYLQSPGIFVWQSSNNRVSNNLINDINGAGIKVTGRIFFEQDLTKPYIEAAGTIRWDEIPFGSCAISPATFEKRLPYLHTYNNFVEYNEIYDVGKTMGDVDAIYISGTGKHNVIRRNYIHDCMGYAFVSGIRTDGDTYDQFIIENIVVRIGIGGGYTSNQRNYFQDNIAIDVLMSKKEWIDWGYLSMLTGPMSGSIHQRNIFYSKNATQKIITENLNHANYPAYQEVTYTNNNVYYNEENPNWADSYFQKWRELGLEVDSVNENPLFYDVSKDDLRLKPNSVAHKKGFRQFYHGDIGLTEGFRFISEDKIARILLKSDNDLSSVSLKKGQNRQLQWVIKTSKGYSINIPLENISFTSLDEGIVKVDSQGIVTGIASGGATVTVTANYNNNIATSVMQFNVIN